MIQKFKDILKVSKNLEEVDRKLSSISSDAEILKKDMAGVKAAVEEMRNSISNAAKSQEALLREFNSHISAISSARKEMEDELFKFSVLKGQMQDRIMKKFADELEKEILERKNELSIDTGKYREAKAAIEGIASELGKAGLEIKKWREISSKIKSEDFELVRFTKKLKELEGEKLGLMQKIDVLERLVGKMRRNGRR